MVEVTTTNPYVTVQSGTVKVVDKSGKVVSTSTYKGGKRISGTGVTEQLKKSYNEDWLEQQIKKIKESGYSQKEAERRISQARGEFSRTTLNPYKEGTFEYEFYKQTGLRPTESNVGKDISKNIKEGKYSSWSNFQKAEPQLFLDPALKETLSKEFSQKIEKALGQYQLQRRYEGKREATLQEQQEFLKEKPEALKKDIEELGVKVIYDPYKEGVTVAEPFVKKEDIEKLSKVGIDIYKETPTLRLAPTKEQEIELVKRKEKRRLESLEPSFYEIGKARLEEKPISTAVGFGLPALSMKFSSYGYIYDLMKKGKTYEEAYQTAIGKDIYETEERARDISSGLMKRGEQVISFESPFEQKMFKPLITAKEIKIGKPTEEKALRTGYLLATTERAVFETPAGLLMPSAVVGKVATKGLQIAVPKISKAFTRIAPKILSATERESVQILGKALLSRPAMYGAIVVPEAIETTKLLKEGKEGEAISSLLKTGVVLGGFELGARSVAGIVEPVKARKYELKEVGEPLEVKVPKLKEAELQFGVTRRGMILETDVGTKQFFIEKPIKIKRYVEKGKVSIPVESMKLYRIRETGEIPKELIFKPEFFKEEFVAFKPTYKGREWLEETIYSRITKPKVTSFKFTKAGFEPIYTKGKISEIFEPKYADYLIKEGKKLEARTIEGFELYTKTYSGEEIKQIGFKIKPKKSEIPIYKGLGKEKLFKELGIRGAEIKTEWKPIESDIKEFFNVAKMRERAEAERIAKLSQRYSSGQMQQMAYPTDFKGFEPAVTSISDVTALRRTFILEGEKFTPKTYFDFKGIIGFKGALDIRTKEISGIKTSMETYSIPKIDIKQITGLEPISEQRIEPITSISPAISTKVREDVISITEPITRTTTITREEMKREIERKERIEEEPAIVPMAFNLQTDKEKLEKVEPYQAYIKERGKWIKKGSATTKKEALDIGAKYVDETPSARFKIVKSKDKPKKNFGVAKGYFSDTREKFREYKIKRRTKVPLKREFIEKEKYRIDKFGERAGITAKGTEIVKLKKYDFGIKKKKGKKKRIGLRL